jgi:hypothetical protein
MSFQWGYPAINAFLLLVVTIAALLALSFAVHVLIEKRYARALKGFLNRAIDRMARTRN